MGKETIIGNALRKARNRYHLTQRELADNINEYQSNISKWENGKSIPAKNQLSKICNYLDIDISEVLDKQKKSLYEKELEFGTNVMDILKIREPSEFYEHYRLINKEQIIVFPKSACLKLIKDIEDKILNCTNFAEDLKKHELISVEMLRIKDLVKDNFYNRSANQNHTTSYNDIYKIAKEFIVFWIWVNQMIAYISKDLTEESLEVMIDPITDEEFHDNKKHFPSDPGLFLNKIILTRLYKKLDSEVFFNSSILKDVYETSIKTADIKSYLEKKRNKYISEEKIKFY